MQANNLRSRTINTGAESLVSTHSVLRNTYLLLSLTLIFSAVCAGLSMVANVPYPGIIVTLIGFYGLMFLTYKTKDSVWGLVSTFAFTGFVGYTLGPLLNAVMAGNQNGGQIIMTALGGTGLIFFALSGYVLTTRKDMSFMSGAMVIGTIVGLLMMVGAIFLKIPGFYLAVSGFFMLLSSGWILWQTSEIIHGGERNYIMATIGLYVQLYNIFVSLLSILSAFSSRD